MLISFGPSSLTKVFYSDITSFPYTWKLDVMEKKKTPLASEDGVVLDAG